MRPCSSSITILSVRPCFTVSAGSRIMYSVTWSVAVRLAGEAREMSVILAELFRGCPEGQLEKFPAPDERHPENELHVLRAVRYLVREIPERAVTSGNSEPSPVVAGVRIFRRGDVHAQTHDGGGSRADEKYDEKYHDEPSESDVITAHQSPPPRRASARPLRR